MITLITRKNFTKYSNLLEKVYRFRHDFFVDHMKWENLRRPDSREIDEFDTVEAIHIVDVKDDQIAGYTRLLPTTRPHLLSHVYPELLQGAQEPVGPDIWEWTRAAVAPRRRDSRSATDSAPGRMYASVVETCFLFGIRGLVVQTSPLLLTRVIGLGFDPRPLALPMEHRGRLIVPFYTEPTDRTLATIRRVFELHGPVLSQPATEETFVPPRGERRP
jgi:acyl-homoserine lactone synthase